VTRIDELIAEYCPDGVTYRRVGDIAVVGTGSSDRKDANTEGSFPFYVRSRGVMRKNTFEFDEEAVLIPGEGGIGEIFHYVNGKYALHQRAYRISFYEDDLDAKFAYWYFTANFKSFILSKAVSATVTSIRKPMITDFRIPVPPLEIQREIVSTLAKMEKLQVDLQAELQAELQARSRQYVFYRDQLLNFSDAPGVRWVPMGQVGEFIRGRRFTKSDVVDEGIPSIHYGEIYTRYGVFASSTVSHVRSDLRPALRFAKPGDLVIAGVGETVEDVCKAVAWLGDDEVAIHDDCFAFRHDMNPKFVSYCFQTERFNAEKVRQVARAKVKRVSAESLAKLAIPVPPRAEQERIVAILDRFDALVNELSVGLPAEIAARRQQYEYYRDKLLTFPERPDAA
jgi:type I restriction enzyme S subunit